MSAPPAGNQLFRRKPVAAMVEETGLGGTGAGETGAGGVGGGALARRMGVGQLMGLGIGATIGTAASS